MSKVLVLSVGGSCAPIVKSIQKHAPTFVHFICNADDPQSGRRGTRVVIDGEGLVCGEDRSALDLPNILTQTALSPGTYSIHEIQDPDDLDECYRVASDVLAGARAARPAARLLADYTGATKSMSAGLVVAALTHDVELQIIRGERKNLGKAVPDTTYAQKSHITGAFLDRQLDVVASLEGNADYRAAAGVIEDLMREHAPQGETHTALHARLLLCRAFDAWDSFNHLDAFNRLQGLQSKALRNHVRPWIDALHVIVQSRAVLDDSLREDARDLLTRPFPAADRFEIVRDLLANADRRARQGRYDDAVGRLYRATELVAQVALRNEFDVRTSDVDVSSLPEPIQADYAPPAGETTRLELDMVRAHDLLARLSDAYGALWTEHRASVIDALRVRNHSVLAHGFEPVGESQYYQIKARLGAHVLRTMERLGGEGHALPGLPNELGRLVGQATTSP